MTYTLSVTASIRLHMPSGSNVLLVVVKLKVSLLYLEELENSVLRVTPALQFYLSTENLSDVMLGQWSYNLLVSVEGSHAMRNYSSMGLMINRMNQLEYIFYILSWRWCVCVL